MCDEAANKRRDNQPILERLTTQAETNRLVGREWSQTVIVSLATYW